MSPCLSAAPPIWRRRPPSQPQQRRWAAGLGCFWRPNDSAAARAGYWRPIYASLTEQPRHALAPVTPPPHGAIHRRSLPGSGSTAAAAAAAAAETAATPFSKQRRKRPPAWDKVSALFVVLLPAPSNPPSASCVLCTCSRRMQQLLEHGEHANATSLLASELAKGRGAHMATAVVRKVQGREELDGCETKANPSLAGCNTLPCCPKLILLLADLVPSQGPRRTISRPKRCQVHGAVANRCQRDSLRLVAAGQSPRAAAERAHTLRPSRRSCAAKWPARTDNFDNNRSSGGGREQERGGRWLHADRYFVYRAVWS